MKALITGATGFVGNHLARMLLNEGLVVWGTALNDREKMDSDISYKVNLLTCDIRNPDSIRAVLTTCQPDYIFHLAAQSNVARSWEKPAETFEINAMGTVHLMDEVVRLGFNSKLLLVGSAEEYGRVTPAQVPIKETTPLEPVNPYGSSKAAISMLFRQYFVKFGLPVIYVRAFNHIGPGQAPGFVTVDFARQIAEIEDGIKEAVVKVGNLEAKRDFSDVRDVVRAYWMLIRQGLSGEVYNVSSGCPFPVRRILDIFLEKAKVKIEILPDQNRMRPSDVPILSGDITKIKAVTDWAPTISIEQSLVDILDYWRDRK